MVLWFGLSLVCCLKSWWIVVGICLFVVLLKSFWILLFFFWVIIFNLVSLVLGCLIIELISCIKCFIICLIVFGLNRDVKYFIVKWIFDFFFIVVKVKLNFVIVCLFGYGLKDMFFIFNCFCFVFWSINMVLNNGLWFKFLVIFSWLISVLNG